MTGRRSEEATLRHLFLQLSLETHRENRDYGQNGQNGQRVPGHGLARCGQLVQRRSGVYRYERWRSDSNECTKEEDSQWYVDDRRSDVDKPIWKERRNSQEDDVIDEVFSVFIDLL